MNTLATKQTEVKYAMRGARGMLPYPAGEYNENTTYTATANVAPFVLFNGTYYVMNRPGTWLGTSAKSDPQKDYAAYGQQAAWIPFEDYKAVYVELLMARLGLIGKSVFWDNYTFSQKGVDKQGEPSDQYQKFESGEFVPNILIDWVEGTMKLLRLVAEGADIQGTIKAVAGAIGNFRIDNSGLRRKDGKNEVTITPDMFRLIRAEDYPTGEVARSEVHLGKNADPSLGEGDDFRNRTAAYFYRRMNALVGYEYLPAMRIVSDNVMNRNVGLRVDGGCIVGEQGVLSRVMGFNPTADNLTVLPADKGSDFMIWNDVNRTIYLPKREDLCKAFGKEWSRDWVTARMTVTSHRGSPKPFVLSFRPDDGGTFYDHNGNVLGKVELAKGDSFSFYLVSEPDTFWAQQIGWSR